MKQSLTLLFSLCILHVAFAQNVGIGTTTPGSKLQVAGSFAPNYTVVTTSPYTLGVNDYYVLFQGGFAAGTFKLPAGTAAMKGRNYFIKNGSANVLTIKAAGTETIDGDSATKLATGEVAHIIMKGTTGSGVATSEVVAVTQGSYYLLGPGVASKPWSTNGNSGTTPDNNFIGTTDQQDFAIRTYYTERMRVLSTGEVGIGTTTPGAALQINRGISSSTNETNNILSVSGSNTGAAYVTGINVFPTLTTTQGVAYLNGIHAHPTFSGNSLQSSNFCGVRSEPHVSSGSILQVTGGEFSPQLNLDASDSVGAVTGLDVRPYISGSGGVQSAYGIYTNLGGAGRINTIYGIYVDGVIATTQHNYALVTSFFAGNVGLGTASPNPAYRLEVVGDINAIGNVRANGIALSSDARLKRNISSLHHALPSVMALKPVTYQKKTTIAGNDYSRNEIGFVAQDVRKVFPSLVYEEKSTDKMLALDYNSLIPVLTKAIQEQQAEIKEQKAKMKQQQAEIKALKNSLASYASLAQQVKELQQLTALSARNKEIKLAKN